MNTREITCTCCPLGCPVTVQASEDGAYDYVRGAVCGRGQKYAVAEASDPVRVITASLHVEGSLEPLSVKTSEAIPKILLTEALEEIKQLTPTKPITCGDVLHDNLCGTGIEVVATKNLR